MKLSTDLVNKRKHPSRNIISYGSVWVSVPLQLWLIKLVKKKKIKPPTVNNKVKRKIKKRVRDLLYCVGFSNYLKMKFGLDESRERNREWEVGSR